MKDLRTKGVKLPDGEVISLEEIQNLIKQVRSQLRRQNVILIILLITLVYIVWWTNQYDIVTRVILALNGI